jgi:galactonate dehydratase
VAASTPNFKIQEHFNDFADAWVKGAVTGMVEVDAADGCFPLPTGSGLGVTLNEAFVAEHPPEHAFFDLFAENWHRRQAGTRSTTGPGRGGATPSPDVEVHHD